MSQQTQSARTAGRPAARRKTARGRGQRTVSEQGGPEDASTGRTAAERSAPEPADAAQNCVSLIGRVSSAPLERELPSGDTIITFRIVLARGPSPMTKRSRQTSDWVDCVVWGSRVRRSAKTWRVDDVVEVEGALRRRFFRTRDGASTRVEVEVLSGRALARARRSSSQERAAEAG